MKLPQQATALDVYRCDCCGQTHIALFDDNGEVFAEIALEEGEMLGFGDQVCTICEEICDDVESSGGQHQPDTIGRTEGNA